MQQNWHIPAWIASRSYFFSTEKARTIITNSRWGEHLVLDNLSSDMWSKLPESFTIDSLAKPLAAMGIDLDDTEHREEVENFLESLRQEGCLVLDGADNPQPAKISVQQQQEDARQITSVAAKFNDGLSEEGILATVFLELTYRCNEKCVHCFNPRYKVSGGNYSVVCSNEVSSIANGELSTAEVKALLNEMSEMGVYVVTFSGGEASLRNDFFELLDEAKRLKLAVSVFTNGQIPEENIRRLAGYYPQTVGVSVYSANPEIHDATTRIKGSFEKSVKALKLLNELGIRTSIKSPQMNHTVHGYKALLKLCDELGAIPQLDYHISPSTDGTQSVSVHQILDRNILEQVFREPRTPLYVGLETLPKGRRIAAVDDTLCGAGSTSLSVCPDGTVYPCNSLPVILGNARNGGLRKIWEESDALKNWQHVTMQDTNECGLYQKCLYCNYCPGMAMLETNDLFGTSKTCCTTAEVRRDLALHLAQSPGTDNFGNDLTFIPPLATELVPTAYIEINHNGEDFVNRVKEINRNGNTVRQTKNYEPDSPMDLYQRGELRKDQTEGRFFETGR